MKASCRGALVGALAVMIGSASPALAGKWTGWRSRSKCCPTCPPATVVEPKTETTIPKPTEPSTPTTPAEPDAPAFDDLLDSAGALETAGGAADVAPYMLGDSLGLTGNFFLGYINDSGQQVSANTSAPLAGGRRLKIAESTSPMPRNRVFFNYNLFRDAYQTQGVAGGVRPLGNNVPNGGPIGGPNGISFPPGGPGAGSRSFDAHRYTFGIEKTFFGGQMSAELRIPFSNTLDNDLLYTENNIPGEQATEFDNISVTLKSFLYRTERLALSGGMLINLPTSGDIVIVQQFSDGLGAPIGHTITVDNETVTLAPFLGLLFTPNDRLFIQSFMQLAVGLNGNTTTFTPVNGGVVGADQVRSLDDQNQLLLDLAVGYWIYRNPCGWLRGVAPIMEVHYTTTVNDSDLLQFDNTGQGNSYTGIFGNTLNRQDIVNLTVGSAMRIGDRSTVSTGFVFPLNKSQADQNFQFDWEFQLQLNFQFGPLGRVADSPIFN